MLREINRKREEKDYMYGSPNITTVFDRIESLGFYILSHVEDRLGKIAGIVDLREEHDESFSSDYSQKINIDDDFLRDTTEIYRQCLL
jgi:hypothetical protein